MNNMTSVIMPVGANEKESSYMRTINSLIETARNKIEILFLADGWQPNNNLFDIYPQVRVLPSEKNLGERITVNRGASLANGEYIFRIDAHCKMSENWDVRLKEACSERVLLVCVLDALNEKEWKELGHNYTFVYVTPSAEEKWWGNYKKKEDTSEVQETMSLTGCGWFCRTDYFKDSLWFDESFGKWGCIGPELTVKAFKSHGKMLLHKGVRCAHLFNTNPKGYPVSVVTDTRKKLLGLYHKELYTIAKRFSPVPSWENVEEDYMNNWESYFMYNTDVTKQDKVEVKDKDGKVIKKVIKYYKPVKYVGKENPDIPEIGRKVTENAVIERIKVAELENENKWKFTDYKTKQEIEMYLFENE